MSPARTAVHSYRWGFKARFRRHAFGWRSQPAVQRVKEAVSEVKQVARRDPILAADGAVSFLERLSPALEHVDGSSGAIGTAVNNALRALVPIIVDAPADPAVREDWLERLWAAHEADRMPYIEILADYWGNLCTSKEEASMWADRLIGLTRIALSPDPRLRGHFHGTSACLSALYRAERYDEVVDIVGGDCIWPYKRWAVRALAAKGHKAEALRYAESCRGPWTPDEDVNRLCEEILLSSGLVDEAYERYGLRANVGSTYLATFRAVAKKYPHKDARQLLADLVRTTAGNEAKWFAAAKEAGLFDEALDLAGRSPCDPKTLARAARDFAEKQPAFARGAGLLSLQWLVAGYGYEVTSADVWAAYTHTMKAAANAGNAAQTLERVKQLVGNEGPGGFVWQVLGSELSV
jgi:hypothetical protein